MRSKITACPKQLQVEKVGTVTSPVTHTEVVAVNSASRKGAPWPSRVAKGSVSSSVIARNCAGPKAPAQQDDGQKAQQRGLRAVQAWYFMLPHAYFSASPSWKARPTASPSTT